MIAGRYTLEREIGRGGAGVVHLARDGVLDRPVAIKRMGLLPGTTEDDVARAQREARLAAGINHPHVVSILDLVKDEDCYWLVMELVDGRTLSELVAAEGALAPQRAAGLLAQAADGLVEANRAGIVHRDVKPSNIMVDDADRVKLGDFGIARSANDDALTRTGLVTGSPAYLAPEVASGAAATPASDVWSLGATLFHAVEGRAPYTMGQNILGGLYKIVHDEPPRLPDGHPLADVLAGMMTKDPQQRWSVVEVRDELQRVARGESGAATLGGARDGADATMVMGTAATAETGDDRGGAPTPVSTATEAVGPDRSVVRRRPTGWLVAALALLLLAGVGAWLVWPGDGDRPDTTAGTAGTGQSDQPSPSVAPTKEPSKAPTETPTQQPTTEPSAPAGAGAQRAAMRTFVEDYFARVTSDPRSTFEMLTPEFKAESGGYGGYSGFWSTISSATPYDIDVNTRTLVASYTIDYVTTAGDTKTQQVQLQLVQQGDGYLIAGEA